MKTNDRYKDVSKQGLSAETAVGGRSEAQVLNEVNVYFAEQFGADAIEGEPST